MGVIQRVVKPKTHRGKRELAKRESKLIENTKQCLFLRGLKCSESLLKFVKDLAKVKKPNAVYFNRKNEFRPFEATNEIESICKKYDSSLFGFASHSKKRPNNLVLGRLFEAQVLDMVEFGLENVKCLEDFKNRKFTSGSKPCLIFMGDGFQTPSSDLFRLKNLFIDFFHGEEIVNIRLEGIEHVISFLSIDNKIVLKSYRILMKKSGEKVPFIELDEIGPSVDLIVRRTKLASADLFKSSCKQPRELKVKKVKNITKDPFGSKLGRVHMPKQNLKRLPTRNMKGLKKTVAEKKLERAKKVKTAKENQTGDKPKKAWNSDPSYGTRSQRRKGFKNSNSGLTGANLTPVSKPNPTGASPSSTPSSSLTPPVTRNSAAAKLLNFTSSIKVNR